MRRLVLPLALLLLAGCGGQGGGRPAASGRGGRATLSVKWPASTRLIPASAQSLVVTAILDGKTVGKATVRKPDTSGTLTGLPYGELSVEVKAYPNADGTGVAQASGAGSMRVAENAPGTVAVNLASTVDRLTVAATTVKLGLTKSVAAEALDKDGAMVLIPAETLSWSSDDASIATVEGAGPTATLKGVALGTTAIHATIRTTDGGAIVEGVGAATVAAAVPTIAVAPTTANVGVGKGAKFTATVEDLADGAVVWSAERGAIDAAGNYVAPATVGDDTVTATSVSMPGLRTTANVRVTGVVTVSNGYVFTTNPDDKTYSFTATVSGFADQEVTWKASSGAISADGVFTPAYGASSATITATSVADPTVSASTALPLSSLVIFPTRADFQYNSGGYLTGQASRTFAVSGSASHGGITWSGAPNGTYRAPSYMQFGPNNPRPFRVFIRATSKSDPSRSVGASAYHF